jgi:hypothetical protein
MVDTSHYYRKNEQILCKELEDGPVLIDAYRRTLVRLNPTALEIWGLLDGGHSVDEIIVALRDTFEIGEQELKKDVIKFLQELAKREMIL